MAGHRNMTVANLEVADMTGRSLPVPELGHGVELPFNDAAVAVARRWKPNFVV